MKAIKKVVYSEIKYKNICIKMFEIIGVLVLALVITYFYFDFYIWDFRIPITYKGGDAFSAIATMKMRMNGDGYRMGWPYYEDLSMYSPSFNKLSQFGARFIAAYTDDFYVAENLFLLAIPVLNIMSAYFVFCKLGIRRWLSYAGSLIFALCPYIQMRLFNHQDLAAAECVPIAFMLCIWLMEDDKFAVPCKGYFKNIRNLLLILFGFLIANNGIVYYPFFSCFIILITGVVICLNNKNVRSIIPSVVTIGNIVFWVLVGFIPAIRGAAVGRGDVATNGAVRDAYRADFFGLDIKALFLSPKGFGFDSLKERYSYLFDNSYEQEFAYLGIAGIIGIIILFFFLLVDEKEKRDNKSINRIMLMSKLNIMLILLGTAGGLGVIVALFLPFISSYNRVGIFILFASLLALLQLINDIVDKFKSKKIKKYLLIIFFSMLFIISLFEQRKSYRFFNERVLIENAERLYQDQAFFSMLENMAGEGAMVYMLPYMKTFENKEAGALNDYELYRGYLNTDTIKWSYGGLTGGKNDLWNRATSELDGYRMVGELRERGFVGIYLDLSGFDGDEGITLYKEIVDCLGEKEVLIHGNGNIIYIPLV